MKPYEKPRLIALSLQGNERLCGDCAQSAIKISTNPTGYFGAFGVLDSDGKAPLEKSDFEGVFSSADACKNNPSIGTTLYCKFNGAMTVAWS